MTLQEALTELDRQKARNDGLSVRLTLLEKRITQTDAMVRGAEAHVERAEVQIARSHQFIHNGALENDRLRNAHELIVLRVAEYQRQDKYAKGLVEVGRIAFAALSGEVPE